MRTVRPLAWAGATAFAVLFGCLRALPSATFLPLAGVLFVIGILFGFVNRERNGGLTVPFVILIASALTLGRAGVACNYQKEVQKLADGELHTVSATVQDVEEGLYPNSFGAKMKVSAVDGKSCRSFTVLCQDMYAPEIGQIVGGQVIFSLPQGNTLLTYLAGRVSLCCQQGDTQSLSVQGNTVDLSIALNQIRRHLGSQFLLLGRRQGGIAAAMVVGDKSRLDDGSRTLFRTAGISHLLVVSGLHLTMTVAMIAPFLRRFFGFRVGNLLCCLPVVAIMLLTGLTPSVVRAGIMMLLTLFAPVLFRSQDTLSSLGAAMLILLAVNPFSACDVGLQLSFSATLGGICFHSLSGALHAKRKVLNALLEVLKTLALPVAISFFTVPVIALQGGNIGISTILCNVICVPFMSVLLCAGWLFLLSHGIFPTGNLYLSGRLLKGLISGMEWVSQAANNRFPQQVGISGAFIALITVGSLAVTVLWYYSRLKRFFWLAGLFLFACGLGLSVILNIGTVSIIPVGEAANPSVIVSCNGESCVIFRGRRTDLQTIQTYLKQHNLAQPTKVISLSSQNFSTEITEALGRLDWQPDWESDKISRLEGIGPVQFTVVSQKEGYLALIHVQGYSIGVCSGMVDCTSYPKISAFIAGLSKPVGLKTGLVFGSRQPKWIEQVQAEQTIFARKAFLWLRPGKATKVMHRTEPGELLF